uniref:Uncharacterized protein n=1 Tax=Anopheles atroparvus TaxID=41427 RepID=A0A182J8A2_ANOAO
MRLLQLLLYDVKSSSPSSSPSSSSSSISYSRWNGAPGLAPFSVPPSLRLLPDSMISSITGLRFMRSVSFNRLAGVRSKHDDVDGSTSSTVVVVLLLLLLVVVGAVDDGEGSEGFAGSCRPSEAAPNGAGLRCDQAALAWAEVELAEDSCTFRTLPADGSDEGDSCATERVGILLLLPSGCAVPSSLAAMRWRALSLLLLMMFARMTSSSSSSSSSSPSRALAAGSFPSFSPRSSKRFFAPDDDDDDDAVGLRNRFALVG